MSTTNNDEASTTEREISTSYRHLGPDADLPCHHHEGAKEYVPSSAEEAMHIFKSCMERHVLPAVFEFSQKEEMAISVIGSRLADQHATETERLNEQMEKMRAVIQATSVMLDDVGVFVERSRTEGPSGENGVGDVGVDDDDLIRAADEAERASRGEKNVSGSASSVVTGENGSKGSGRGRSVGAKES